MDATILTDRAAQDIARAVWGNELILSTCRRINDVGLYRIVTGVGGGVFATEGELYIYDISLDQGDGKFIVVVTSAYKGTAPDSRQYDRTDSEWVQL